MPEIAFDFDPFGWFDQMSGKQQQMLLLAFLSIAVFTAAVIIVLRAMFVRRETAVADVDGKSLRRQRTVFDQEPATSLPGRLNQWFDRLVLESGMNFTPLGALLLLLAWGTLGGGICLVIWTNPLAAVVGATLTLIAVLFILAWVRRRRMRRIRDEVPYVADLLARGVRAGESLDQAIAMVGRESGGPLGGEFQKCSRQLEMGRSMSSVMRGLTARVRLIETRVLASTLIVHRQTGGNLATALERMASTIRDRINYQRQLRASTGAARTSAAIIASITPVVFLLLFLWQPEHFRELLVDPIGRSLLFLAFVLEIIGIVWVVRILRTD